MNPEQELFLTEIEARYSGQWVLIEETDWDKQGNPIKGVVVAHDIDRERLIPYTRQLHNQKPGVKTFTFYAGPKVPENLIVIL